jgi:hypothetical protein
MVNVTVPVGIPVPGGTGDTVAASSTGWFSSDGFADEVSAVLVASSGTVSVAAFEVEVPTELVKTARYWLALCPAAAVKLSVVDVAPAMSANAPPTPAICHRTVGVGSPVAAAVNVAVWPAFTVWFVGCWVTVGGLVVSP